MRRLRWIGLAVLLLGTAALLLRVGEREPAPPPARVEFPRWRAQERERARKRDTLVLPPAPTPPPPAAAPAAEPAPRRRDPFLVALPVSPGAPVVVFEANALRNSQLGERFIACVSAEEPELLSGFRRDTGIDPLKDIDRVAFLGDSAVVSGFFDGVPWDALGPAEAYGDAGRIYRKQGVAIGAWRDQILVLSATADAARRAIDQLEGRAPVPESGIPEDMTYGEVYGVVPAAAARRLLGAGDPDLATRIAQLAGRVELHVDAMQDVAAVVRVRLDDAAGLGELATSLGAALGAAQLKARAAGDHGLADLLENAQLDPGQGELTLQVALPADRLAAWFGQCGSLAGSPAP